MCKFRKCRPPECHPRGVSKSGQKLLKSLFVNAALNIYVSALPKLYCKNIRDGLVPPAFTQHSDLDYVSSLGSCLIFWLLDLKWFFLKPFQCFKMHLPKVLVSGPPLSREPVFILFNWEHFCFIDYLIFERRRAGVNLPPGDLPALCTRSYCITTWQFQSECKACFGSQILWGHVWVYHFPVQK